MKVAFRVDGSKTIGSGHFMRCIVLANQLRKLAEANITFISYNHENNLNYIPSELDYTCVSFSIPNGWNEIDDIIWVINKFRDYNFDIIFVDHYNLTELWESKAREISEKIFVIDDLANRKHDCDYLLDQNCVDNYKLRYDKLVRNNTVKLLGTNYLLLRDEFIQRKKDAKVRINGLNNLLISFGGTDPFDLTIKTLNSIQKIYNSFKKIHVVIGKQYNKIENVKEILKNYSNSILHIDTKQMANIILNSDLCIGAGGTSAWERCFLKLPSLIVVVADNQIEISQFLNHSGAAKNIGEAKYLTELNIKENIQIFLDNKKVIEDMSKQCSNVINDESFLGPDYICNLILK